MLILLPPSESKLKPPESGDVLRLDRLSFPELNPIREVTLRALGNRDIPRPALPGARPGFDHRRSS